MKNTVEIEGVVKWEPKSFPPREEGHRLIVVFAVEFTGKNDRKSVFHIKAFGSTAEKLNEENLSQGDQLLVKGMLNEGKWKDKDDNWHTQIEVWANQIEFIERVGGDTGGEFAAAPAGGADDDDIPF